MKWTALSEDPIYSPFERRLEGKKSRQSSAEFSAWWNCFSDRTFKFCARNKSRHLQNKEELSIWWNLARSELCTYQVVKSCKPNGQTPKQAERFRPPSQFPLAFWRLSPHTAQAQLQSPCVPVCHSSSQTLHSVQVNREAMATSPDTVEVVMPQG